MFLRLSINQLLTVNSMLSSVQLPLLLEVVKIGGRVSENLRRSPIFKKVVWMFTEQSAGRNAGYRLNSGDEGAFHLISDRMCKALGHTLIALIVAGGFVKLAYVEAGEAVRRGRRGARA